MRLIKMTGGLGNQMFIYALYLAMRRQYHDTRIDLSDMMHYHVHHGYELPRLFHLDDHPFCIHQGTKKVIEFLFFKTILERKQNMETLEAYRRPYLWPFIYFKGFYQDERYFKDIEDEVRRTFTFDTSKANAASQALLRQIDADPHAVSLHVRRGDYLLPQHWTNSGSVCQKEYYTRAIARMRELQPEAHFYVFSDDLPWVKEHIALPADTIFIDCNHGADSWQDMMLMSRCRHNVICNSTFSWWGAWLNAHPDKMVVCPNRWAANSTDTRILPEAWIRVETGVEETMKNQ